LNIESNYIYIYIYKITYITPPLFLFSFLSNFELSIIKLVLPLLVIKPHFNLFVFLLLITYALLIIISDYFIHYYIQINKNN